MMTLASSARGAEPASPRLQTDTARNLRGAFARAQLHGNAYSSPTGRFGSTKVDEAELVALESVPLTASEAWVPENLLRAHPVLARLTADCACRSCTGETERIYCWSLHHSLGLGWQPFRRRAEFAVSLGQYDVVFFPNVTMMHGAIAGDASRTLKACT